jgi:hypothetical protein
MTKNEELMLETLKKAEKELKNSVSLIFILDDSLVAYMEVKNVLDSIERTIRTVENGPPY